MKTMKIAATKSLEDPKPLNHPLYKSFNAFLVHIDR